MKSKKSKHDGRFAEIGTFSGAYQQHAAIDALKFELCRAIDQAIARHQWSYHQAAKLMRVSRSNLSRVGNKRIETLTLNQLFRYLGAVCPGFRVMISIDSSLTAIRPAMREH